MTMTTTTNECPWLARAMTTRVLIEGRARLPDGYQRPDSLKGFPVTWRFDADRWVWRFRIEGPGDASHIQTMMESNFLMGQPMRFDRATLEAPSVLKDDGLPEGGEVETDDEGQPTGVKWLDKDATEDDLSEVRNGAKLVFGDAMALGPWERYPDGWWAPVLEWRQ